MEVKLVVAIGKNAGQVVNIRGPKFLIGRAEDCHLRPRSDTVSRHHCAILVDEGFVAIRDFGSKNGTFVNDERVRAEAELKNGDRLRVGKLEFDIQLVTDVGGKKKPKVESVQEAAVRTAKSAPTVNDDDVDLDDWFGEDAASHVGDTTTLDQSRADANHRAPGTDEGQLQGQPAETAALKKLTEEENTVKVPGSWSRKPTAASTRDAAGDALRNFFRGR